jgi:hypothetical protein
VAKGEVTDMPGLAVSRRLVELWIDDALDGQSEGPALGARDLRPTSGARGLVETGFVISQIAVPAERLLESDSIQLPPIGGASDPDSISTAGRIGTISAWLAW